MMPIIWLSRFESCVNCVLTVLHCSPADDDASMCVARGSSNISAPRPAKVGFTNVREGSLESLALGLSTLAAGG